jgi:putative aldouronate transport system substrate-binding protein
MKINLVSLLIGQEHLERQAPTWAITSQAENPEAIFEYFFETMLDGGLGQKLFTYGAEGTHWSTEGGELLGVTYEDGQFHMLENMEKAGTLYTKNHIDPMMALTNFTEFDDPGILSVAEEALVSAKTFGENSRLVELVPSSEVMSQYNGDLVKLKREIVANVVLGTRTIEEEMQRFEDEGGLEWSQMIVDSLNE